MFVSVNIRAQRRALSVYESASGSFMNQKTRYQATTMMLPPHMEDGADDPSGRTTGAQFEEAFSSTVS